MLRGVPIERLGEGGGLGGGRNRRKRPRALRNVGRPLPGARLLEGARHVGDRLRFAHGLDRQPDPESALDAQDQFRAAEAVDPEIAIEPAGQRNVDG